HRPALTLTAAEAQQVVHLTQHAHDQLRAPDGLQARAALPHKQPDTHTHTHTHALAQSERCPHTHPHATALAFASNWDTGNAIKLITFRSTLHTHARPHILTNILEAL